MSKEWALQSLMKAVWFCEVMCHSAMRVVMYKGRMFTGLVSNEVTDNNVGGIPKNINKMARWRWPVSATINFVNWQKRISKGLLFMLVWGFSVVIKWLAGMSLLCAGYLQFQKLLSFLVSKQDFVYCTLRASEILPELEGQPVSGRWWTEQTS